MTIAIKYCGGCNSNFERGVIARKLLTDFPGLDMITGIDPDAPDVPDAVVVVCGCARSCASHEHLTGKRGKFLVHTLEDYEALHDWLLDVTRQPE